MDEEFRTLRNELAKYGPSFSVTGSLDSYYLLTKREVRIGDYARPILFAGLVKRESVISFYFMPIYTNPELLNYLDPDLKAKLAGKTSFSFSHIDDELLAGIRDALKKGLRQFAARGWL